MGTYEAYLDRPNVENVRIMLMQHQHHESKGCRLDGENLKVAQASFRRVRCFEMPFALQH